MKDRSQGFDLARLLEERGAERYELHTRHLNHQLPRMLHTLGFDKVYERAEGAYFWDADGNEYLDMLMRLRRDGSRQAPPRRTPGAP